MELVGNLFIFAGGIGMFLYGMNHRMADGIAQKSAEWKDEITAWIYLTRNRFLARICCGSVNYLLLYKAVNCYYS